MALPTDADILAAYLEAGINEIVTVPCTVTDTWLRLAYAADGVEVVVTSHEGNLVGIACGRYLGTGVPSLVHMQNSGLPNAADGFISFASSAVFALPVAALVTYRGWANADDSEPHQAIGHRTDALVDAIFDADTAVLGSRCGTDLDYALPLVGQAVRARRSVVLKLSPAGFRKSAAAMNHDSDIDRDTSPADLLPVRPTAAGSVATATTAAQARISRDKAIAEILDAHPRAAVLFCNGYMARAAQARHDRLGNFYNVGYMGGTLALGWGLAHSRPDLTVVVVDGDQNAQMSNMREHLAHQPPANLHWYVLDNGVGASVGGAPSLPLSADIRQLATVIPIHPEAPGTFDSPRVRGAGVYHQACPDLPPTLAGLSQGFRRWVDKTLAQH